jgi:two-component system response regulator HydG
LSRPANDNTILVVDDNPSVRTSLQMTLEKQGYHVVLAATGREALELVRGDHIRVMIADLKMPGMDGLELLRAAKQLDPRLEVIMITGYGTVQKAVQAMKEGALDFIMKPFRRAAITGAVRAAMDTRGRTVEIPGQSACPLPNMVGTSQAIRATVRMIRQVAPSTATVLIQGESGTGKEVVADAIHYLSPRRDKPLVKVSCAALPETLLEAELFGHERGAFTNAFQKRIGRFELTAGGTLFLDEIGSMSPATQVKLLRVLQEHRFERLGSSHPVKADFRLVVASNEDLPRLVSKGEFRQDLYYRVNVITIHLKPLRERREDVPPLVDHFIRIYGEKNEKEITGISRRALDLLCTYDWPGNIREVENTIEHAVVLTKGPVIVPQNLPKHISGADARPEGVTVPIGTTLREIEKKAIEETLRYTNGDKTLAAGLLGIATRTIYRKLSS